MTGKARKDEEGLPDVTIGAAGGFPATPGGRPLDPVLRIHTVVALLDSGGYSASKAAIQSMMFWEAVLAGMAGAPDEPTDFVLGPEGLRSASVAAAEAALAEAGAFVDDDRDEPDLIPSRYGKGRAVASWMHGQPRDWSPWFRALHEFVWGFHEVEPAGVRCSVSTIDSDTDLARMLAVDPVAAGLNPGQPSGTALGEGGRALLAAFDRVRLKEMGLACKPYEGSWYLARYLCRQARKADPRFGDGVFLDHLDTSWHAESVDADGLVSVTFHDADGAIGARLAYRPGPEGRVEAIEVPEPMRGRGFGTLALRHALHAEVRATAPVPESARGLFGRHGRLQPDGTYGLCRISWPTCRRGEPNPVPAP